MNKLEQSYYEHLLERQKAGDILEIYFESIKLKLADKCYYTPDFVIMLADGVLEAHEVKGGIWEDDARVKIKVAAVKFPFRFVAVQKVAKKRGGGWKFEEFPG